MSSKKNESGRGYRLMLVPYMGGEDYSFCYCEALNLEEIDLTFTYQFDDFEDMIKEINYREENKLDVIGAYIERIGGKHTRYEILYRGDLFDSEKVIALYREYLLKHPKYFYKESPVHFVNIHREDYKLERDYIERCCYAYFSDGNYRRIRGAYFELKKLGLARNVVSNFREKELDSSQYKYHSDNVDLNEFLNRGEEPDWESINNQFDLEEILRLLKKEPKDSGRGRR